MMFTVSRDIHSRSPGMGDIVLNRREGRSRSIIADTPLMSRVARLRPPVHCSALWCSIVQSCVVQFSAVQCNIVQYSECWTEQRWRQGDGLKHQAKHLNTKRKMVQNDYKRNT